MLFNSIDFAVFLPIVFLLHWFGARKNQVVQNGLIIGASYLFYGWWDWRFLSLILLSTSVDFIVARRMGRSNSTLNRKLLLWISILVNLGLLGFFKYYNFFLDNFVAAFSFFGSEISVNRLNIILPVGISFYTFQTLSYTIDVYRKKLAPTSDFLAFAAFVSFFPQLVAGPIERASRLLPQFKVSRVFDRGQAVDGLRQILWGLFKKLVIADNCAMYVQQVFDDPSEFNSLTLGIGAVLFAIQIYGDFSGYSDIAIGTARLFGVNLMCNFAFPYFSRDIAEFWRRWHISLSTWFRDYVYIPLGGSRGSNILKVRNIFIIFIVSGFWHGANWTFIIWGALNALYFLPLMLLRRNRKHLEIVAQGRLLPGIREIAQMSITFVLTVFAFIFFRADSLDHAMYYITELFAGPFFEMPGITSRLILLVITFLMIIEWIGREQQHALESLGKSWGRLPRWGFYAMIIFLIGMLMPTEENAFIYFQF